MCVPETVNYRGLLILDNMPGKSSNNAIGKRNNAPPIKTPIINLCLQNSATLCGWGVIFLLVARGIDA